MVGTLPRHRLLLLEWDRLVGEFDSWFDLGLYLGVHVDMSTGEVWFKGRKRCPSYRVEYFTRQEIIVDWCKNYLLKNLPSDKYKLYKTIVE